MAKYPSTTRRAPIETFPDDPPDKTGFNAFNSLDVFNLQKQLMQFVNGFHKRFQFDGAFPRHLGDIGQVPEFFQFCDDFIDLRTFSVKTDVGGNAETQFDGVAGGHDLNEPAVNQLLQTVSDRRFGNICYFSYFRTRHSAIFLKQADNLEIDTV